MGCDLFEFLLSLPDVVFTRWLTGEMLVRRRASIAKAFRRIHF